MRDPAIDPAIERDYNPRVTVTDFADRLAASAARAAEARQRLPHRADIRYGAGPRQTLDLFAQPGSGRRRPIAVYIHGGYWRALDKATFSFVAEPILASGGISIVLTYDLCPAVTVADIVREIDEALAWIGQEADGFGGDAARVVVTGHSAGAHLAAMALTNETADPPMRGACLISGVYEIAPIQRTSINAEVRLTPDLCARNSPLLSAPPPAGVELLVAVGGRETPGFIGQSRRYAAHAATGGAAVELAIIEDEDHFSITDRLVRRDHPLVRFALDLFEQP